MDVVARLRRWSSAFALASGLVLAGCGGSANVEPNDLVDFTQTAKANVAWRTSLGGSKHYLLKPAVADGSVYAASSKGQIVALDEATGKQRWRIDADAALTGAVGAGEGLVLAGTRKGAVLAYGSDGKPRWQSQLSSEVLGAPQAARGVVVARTVDGRVFGLDAASGERRWEHQLLLPSLLLRGDSTVELNEDLVLLGTPGGRVLALNLATGDAAWEAVVAQPTGDNEIERITDVAAPPAVEGEQACAAAYQGRVACMDLRRGAVAWARDASSAAHVGIDPITVYVTAPDGVVSAFDRQTGASLWTQDKLLNRSVSGPTAVGDYVIVGDYDGYVHVLDAEDGAFVARLSTDGSAIVAPPLRAGPGVVVQTSAGGLYALSVN